MPPPRLRKVFIEVRGKQLTISPQGPHPRSQTPRRIRPPLRKHRHDTSPQEDPIVGLIRIRWILGPG